MAALESDVICLRALEPEDVDILYGWENDTRLWGVSNTSAPFSRYVLRKFIESQRHDISITGQLRLIIELKAEGRPVGAVDLFEYNAGSRRAGVGIMIYDDIDRGRGYAAGALELLKEYAFGTLRMHQLYCNIRRDNERSIKLFAEAGFEITGLRRDWLVTPSGWADEYMLQLISDSAH